MASIRGDVITVINPSNRRERKELTHEDYKNNVDKKIAQIFNVSVEDVKNQEKLIKQPRGFFWDKIVRLIFGYKFDILREKKNVRNGDLFAFHAAVAKITYDERTEIVDIYKIIEIHKKDFIYINKARIMKFHEELKDEIQVEEEVFEKCFQDFYDEKIKPNMQSKFNLNLGSFKEDFKKFFFNREENFDDETNNDIAKGIKRDLLSKKGEIRFERDSLRSGNVNTYGRVEIRDNAIYYTVKEIKDEDSSLHNDQLSERERKVQAFEVDIKASKGKLKETLRKKRVSGNNIDKIIDFIFYLYSQTAEINLLIDRMQLILLKQDPEDWSLLGINIQRSDLNLIIEIIDDKTIKMRIETKDENQIFKYQKTNGLSLEEWQFVIKNPKSEVTFGLDEKDDWKVKDGKISFQIEKKTKEAK